MPIEPRIKAPLVAVVAERDFVENGKIAEHWDPATKQ